MHFCKRRGHTVRTAQCVSLVQLCAVLCCAVWAAGVCTCIEPSLVMHCFGVCMYICWPAGLS